MTTVSKLQIILEATTTAFDRGLRSATHTLQGFARQVGQMHDRMDGFARRHRDALQGLQSAGQMAVVGLGAMTYGIKGAVDEAVKFEQAMAKVNKVMDFDTPEALQNMRKELEKLSATGTSTFVELVQIAEAGGQLGVLEKDLVPFVSMVSDMATAFDMSADVAGDAMAKLANVWNKPIQEMSQFGDMVNTVSNNTPAKASQIVEALGRIGGTAKSFGLSEQGAVSLTSAMIGLGKAPEVASRAVNHLVSTLATMDMADKNISASLKQLGLDASEFGKLLKTDAEGALFSFLEAMNKLPKDEQIGFSVDMFGKNFYDDILALATAPELLTKIRDLLSDSANYTGSMTKESAVLSATTEGQIQKFKNNITILKASIGTAFLPALTSIMDKLTPIIGAISAWANENPKLITTITAITAGALALVATLGGLALAFTAVTSGIGSIIAIGKMIAVIVAPIVNAIKFVQMFGVVLAGLGFPVTAVVAGITALVVAGVALYKNWDEIKAKAVQVFDSLPAPVQQMASNIKSIFDSLASGIKSVYNGLTQFLSKAFDVLAPIWVGQFTLFKSAAMGAFDFIKGYIGAWVASTKAILTAGLTVFASVFNAGFALIKNAFTTTFNVIKALVRGDMQGVANAIKTGLSNVVAIIKTMAINIVGAFRNLGSQLLQAGKDAIQGFINGVRQKMGEALNLAKQLASQVYQTVKSTLDIHSPSRKMKTLGKHTAEGMAVGIKEATPKAIKQAQKMADDIKKAVADNVANLKKEIALFGDDSPINALKYDINAGKYGKADTKELETLTAQKYALERNKIALDEIFEINKQIETQGLNRIELLQWEISNTKKYAGILPKHLEKLKVETERLMVAQNQFAVQEKIEALNEKIWAVGKSELEILQYQLDHAKEYQGVSDEIKKTYLDRTKTLQDEVKANERLNALQKSRDDFAKQQFVSKNPNDKYAGQRFDLHKQGYINGQIDELLGYQAKTDAYSAFQNLQNTLKQNTPKNPMVDLQAQFNERLNIIRQARESELGVHTEFDKAEMELSHQFLQAKNELMITQSESLFGSMAQSAKTAFGEQSKAYRAIFALEKGMAIARSVMAIQTAMAQASANPFPMNLGAMATVASQVANIVGNIRAVAMPVGQAHDGIMSVPKSGTWNLEKGERVLPKHTAQNLDNTLNRLQGRGETKVIINNYISEKAEVQKNDNGDIMVTIGKMMKQVGRAEAQQVLREELGQNGLISRRLR